MYKFKSEKQNLCIGLIVKGAGDSTVIYILLKQTKGPYNVGSKSEGQPVSKEMIKRPKFKQYLLLFIEMLRVYGRWDGVTSINYSLLNVLCVC